MRRDNETGLRSQSRINMIRSEQHICIHVKRYETTCMPSVTYGVSSTIPERPAAVGRHVRQVAAELTAVPSRDRIRSG